MGTTLLCVHTPYILLPFDSILYRLGKLVLGLFSKVLIALSLLFPTKIGSTVTKCQKLCLRLVVGTARNSTLEKQNIIPTCVLLSCLSLQFVCYFL